MGRLLSCWFLLTLTTSATAAHNIDFTVSAGKSDRVNEPVKISLPLPEGAMFQSSKLVDSDGKAIPSQIVKRSLTSAQEGTFEVHFILPSLKAGATAKFRLTLDVQPEKQKGFSWHDMPKEFTDLKLDGKPVLRYMYHPLDEKNRDATFKVFHHVYDPSGERIITNGAGGQFPHHRGLFYGFMKVTYDGNKLVDIWHCREQTYQSHDQFLSIEGGPVLGRHRVEIGWHGKQKELFAKEERELTVYATPGGRLIEFASKLTPVKGTVKLDGDPQHAGFHFRAANDVAEKSKGETYFIRPDGDGKKGVERNWPAQKEHINLPWNGMSFLLGEKRYTVAYLDQPTNPKEARFSERTYGRFGSYFVTEVEEKKPLIVNYRIWLQDGEMKGDEIQRLSEGFVSPVSISKP
jgi:hypothetical protein